MVDPACLGRIAALLEPGSGQTVLEIGPGLGFLTRELLRTGASVVAVDPDPACVSHLSSAYAASPLELVKADILECRLDSLAVDRPAKVYGNIPYHITSPILEWLIRQRGLVRQAALTVQWEVARRLSARPGTADWGSLTVFVRSRARVTTAFKIDRSAFHPRPRVDSAAVVLDFSLPAETTGAHPELFEALVRRAFQMRRKTLSNALAGWRGLDKAEWGRLFERAGIRADWRAERLEIPQWARLSDELAEAPSASP